MRVDKIVVEPFSFLTFQDLKISKEVNNHAYAYVKGIIKNDTEDRFLEKISVDETISIKGYSEEGEENILFRGLINKISLKVEDGIKILEVWLCSHTCYMDRQKHIRIFQNTEQTYREIVKYIGTQNQSLVICTEGKEQTTGRLIVQYQETDWEFLKRLASMLHTVIVADSINGKAFFSFGPPKPKNGELKDFSYQTIRDMQEYNHFKQNGMAHCREENFTIYQVETREVLELCVPIVFLDKKCVIRKMESELNGRELVNVYELVEEKGLSTLEIFNQKISGISLEGTVFQVAQDQIQVKFSQDVNVPCIWFPYATVYSSPDGTGWYCMPEKGDAVRVYFPDKNERNAVAVSSIHLTCGLHKDADIKYIRSSHEKEIRFEPSAIKITNNKGISVVLDDKRGIILKSSGDILAFADGNIELESKKGIDVIGNKGVTVRQGDNNIEVKNGIKQTAKTIAQK